jgi:acetyl-CoA carboxylase beta subunit
VSSIFQVAGATRRRRRAVHLAARRPDDRRRHGRSEFLQEHGFVDFIVHREDLRSEIARLVDFCGK